MSEVRRQRRGQGLILALLGVGLIVVAGAREVDAPAGTEGTGEDPLAIPPPSTTTTTTEPPVLEPPTVETTIPPAPPVRVRATTTSTSTTTTTTTVAEVVQAAAAAPPVRIGRIPAAQAPKPEPES